MIDSGANPNCISLRCVQGSEYLKGLERHPYSGKRIVDANGEPIQPSFVIKCKLIVGCPKITTETDFVVIQSLPFSCIIGQRTLQTFSSWEVSNTNKLLTINSIHKVPFLTDGATLVNNNNNKVQLMTTQKTVILPFMSKMVDVKASGPALNAFRPSSMINVIVEGNPHVCDRLSVEVLPSINVLTYQNCKQRLKVHNISPYPKTIAKGVNIATCSTEFEECDMQGNVSINLVENLDPVEVMCNNITKLNRHEKCEARKFLQEYRDIFTVSNECIGHTNIKQFDIDDSNVYPVTVPLRRVPIHHKEIVQQLVNKYEQLHLLEPIDSPYRASTVLIQKKNLPNSVDVTDKYRLCTDYRALNNHLISSGWPSPSLGECLDAIGDADMFSAIDFNMGYFQIPCTKRAKQCLAFSPGYGFKQYTWSVMPPGVKTASGCFQQAMSKTFSGHENYILPPFYDDVTIKSRGFKEHLKNARIILNDVRAAKFTLNALKCSFFQTEIKYLGHIISEHKVQVDPERIKAIAELPAPKDAKELRRLIGMVQFCHKFVQNLNVILAPLYDLLKGKRAFIWTDKCENAFVKLKSVLSSPPVLYSPTTEDTFVLETDASDIGLGGCLKAINKRGEFIVGYCSKKFVDNEVGWNIVEKEAFSTLHNVRHFHHYLVGQTFTIKCDNRVVCYLKDKNKPRNKKLLNWTLELSDYDYWVQHIPSKNNNISDCLSRLLGVNKSINLISLDSAPIPDFRGEQDKDDECNAAKWYLSLGKREFDVNLMGSLKSRRKYLHLEDGILKWKNKYVVPKGLRNTILLNCHDHPMAGHYATDRTYQRFHDKYFWPGALVDVENFVNSCEKCNEFNPPRTSYVKAPLQPITSRKRFELVCYDLAGPFTPKTCRGNCYVLIIVDHFSHWPEFVALQDIKAATIATALVDHWCCRYGTPDRFHSDGAHNVHGEVLKELCKHLGIQKTKSSRLHPQGDGMAESFVKQLKSCVQKQVESNGSDWDLFLHTTAFAIRSNTAYNTKLSPAELLFGEKLSTPIDQLIENTPKTFSQKQGIAFAKDVKSMIDRSTSLVNKHLTHSREQMKKMYDKGVKPCPFRVGDIVMLWKPYKRKGVSSCFQPNWHGPWTIVKFTGTLRTNCKIVSCNDPTHKMNVHVNQLKSVKASRGLSNVVSNDEHGSKRTDRVITEDPQNITIPSTQTFLDYLDDFEDDDNNQNDPPIPEQHPILEQPVRPQRIDQSWVTVDPNNILPNRTRGNRVDYSDMAGENV